MDINPRLCLGTDGYDIKSMKLMSSYIIVKLIENDRRSTYLL